MICISSVFDILHLSFLTVFVPIKKPSKHSWHTFFDQTTPPATGKADYGEVCLWLHATPWPCEESAGGQDELLGRWGLEPECVGGFGVMFLGDDFWSICWLVGWLLGLFMLLKEDFLSLIVQ